jgi:hypothetical protein
MSTANKSPHRFERRPAWRQARLILSLFGGLIVAAAVGRQLFFKGPYQVPQPLPAAKLLDIHCHTAGIGAGGSGCFISQKMAANWRLRYYLKSLGTSREQLQQKGDAYVIQLISERLARSQHVGQAIVLALDGVVDERGELDLARTEVYVPNQFVARETAKTTNLLFGASLASIRIVTTRWSGSIGRRQMARAC